MEWCDTLLPSIRLPWIPVVKPFAFWMAHAQRPAAMLFKWTRRLSVAVSRVPEDVELQAVNKSKDSDTKQRCVPALICLFGVPEKNILAWPGVFAYAHFIETCFQPLLTQHYAAIWTETALPRPQSVHDCWTLITSVCATLHIMRNEDCSIEEVWRELQSLQMTESAPNRQSSIALFAVLCWITMTLRPYLLQANRADFSDLELHQYSRKLKVDDDFIERPIHAQFRKLKRITVTDRGRYDIGHHADEPSIALCVPSISFASLHEISRIQLSWVSDITHHLDFDAVNRRLSIFRFPSFCALMAMEDLDKFRDSSSPQGLPMPLILVELLHGLYDIDGEGDLHTSDGAQVYREVLMSYRLLFAQSHKSRLLFQQGLKSLQKQEEDYDTFLETLCAPVRSRVVRGLSSSLWPVTCRAITSEGGLLEQSSYSSQDDFPLLGHRLAKIQEFNMRQQPSRLRDLWRDRRSPLQWYTFWAVLWVGGLTIVLSILQLVAGVIQTVYTAKSVSSSD